MSAADLYDEHADAVYAYLARRVGPDLGRDLLADTFRTAIERFDTFDPSRGAPRAWLFGIATNLLRHHWRTEQRRLAALARAHGGRLDVGDPLLAVDDRVDAARDATRLVEAIGALSPDDRDLLLLVTWEGCSRGEVAEILGIPAGTVRSRLHRIRAALRSDLERTPT